VGHSCREANLAPTKERHMYIGIGTALLIIVILIILL
jgi:hypothetical protein